MFESGDYDFYNYFLLFFGETLTDLLNVFNTCYDCDFSRFLDPYVSPEVSLVFVFLGRGGEVVEFSYFPILSYAVLFFRIFRM